MSSSRRNSMMTGIFLKIGNDGRAPARVKAWLGGFVVMLAVSFGAAAPAAAQATDTFDVTANVVDGCLITAGDLDFGDYSAVAVLAKDATSTIQVDCSTGAVFAVALNEGINGGDFTGRLMTNGTDTLTYNLFLDATRLIVWGDDSGLTQDVTGVSLGAPIDYTVYGRLNAGQDVSTGAYSDTITATITF